MRNTENLFDTRSNSQGLLIVKHHLHNYYEINTITKVLSPIEVSEIEVLFEKNSGFNNYLFFAPNLSTEQFIKLTSLAKGKIAAVVSADIESQVEKNKPFTFFIHHSDPYFAMGEALKYICSSPLLSNFNEEENDGEEETDTKTEFNQHELEELYDFLVATESQVFAAQTEEDALPYT